MTSSSPLRRIPGVEIGALMSGANPLTVLIPKRRVSRTLPEPRVAP